MFIIYFLEFQILESSSGKYLTGDNMTFADLGLLEVLLLLEEFFGMESFDMYPKLKVMSIFLNKLLSSFFDKQLKYPLLHHLTMSIPDERYSRKYHEQSVEYLRFITFLMTNCFMMETMTVATEETIDLGHPADKLYHIMLYRVHLASGNDRTLNFCCDLCTWLQR